MTKNEPRNNVKPDTWFGAQMPILGSGGQQARREKSIFIAAAGGPCAPARPGEAIGS